MISNFRDLGGMRSADHRMIPAGMLFRSANLHKADPEELGGISAVIDLRTSTERERMPDAVPDDVEYHMVPREATLTKVPDMVSLYRTVVVSCQEQIQRALSIIFTHDYSTGGVLWHCTAGKDRCGIITAYVLAALGVSRDDIMTDYLISNESCIPEADTLVVTLTQRGVPEQEIAAIRDAFIAKEEYMLSAMKAMTFEENKAFQKVVFP